MNIYIYIDESGPFDEGLHGTKSSVVGGVCSTLSSDNWETIHRLHLSEFNTDLPLNFRLSFPEHYHCGELLNFKTQVPTNLGRKDREAFTESVYQNVLEKSFFGVLSKNFGKRFEYSPQATYVMNLVAALRHTMDKLASLPDLGISVITVVVAQRTIKETTQSGSVTTYTAALLSFVADQLLVGSGPGVALAKRLQLSNALILESGIATRDAGLIAADFVCCLGRYNKKPTGSALLYNCRPDDQLLLGDYRNCYENRSIELLENGFYGTYLEYVCRFFPFKNGVPEIGRLVARLEAETNEFILERELPTLLAIIHSLSKQRAEIPFALSTAILAAESLIAVAEKQLIKATRKSLWINLKIQALAELVACHNHTGAVGPQQVAEATLSELLENNKKDAGLDAVQRKTFLLDVRNRNLNMLFNDYRFEEAYTLAEELAEDRMRMTGGDEPDTLMGKIRGSQGQACAFLQRCDPGWQADAERLFRESMQHFASGSIQESMARNFLVTSLWQVGNYEQAIAELSQLPSQITDLDHSGVLTARLALPQHTSRSYEVVNVLRLLATLGELHHPPLVHAYADLEKTALLVGTDHPYEQWWKWLGIIHLMLHDYESADSCFTRSEVLCNKHSFTIRTIGNSATLLRIHVARADGEKSKVELLVKKFRVEHAALCRASLGFAQYLPTHRAEELIDKALTTKPGEDNFLEICSYLPFTYA